MQKQLAVLLLSVSWSKQKVIHLPLQACIKSVFNGRFSWYFVVSLTFKIVSSDCLSGLLVT